MFKANKQRNRVEFRTWRTFAQNEKNVCELRLIPSCGNSKIALFLPNNPFYWRFLQCLPFYCFFHSTEFSAAGWWFIVSNTFVANLTVACEPCEQTVKKMLFQLWYINDNKFASVGRTSLAKFLMLLSPNRFCWSKKWSKLQNKAEEKCERVHHEHLNTHNTNIIIWPAAKRHTVKGHPGKMIAWYNYRCWNIAMTKVTSKWPNEHLFSVSP